MILPTLKRLRRGQTEDELITVLNNFMSAIYSALNARLTLQDNFATQEFVAEVNGDSPSISFPSTLQTPAKVVLIVQILRGVPAGAVTAEWRQIGQIIEVTNITGLSAGEQYRLKLLIL